jgi:exonuclease III
MKLVSWNYRGLGNDPKLFVVRDLIRFEKPQILLIQETKLHADEAIKSVRRLWRYNEALAVDFRGASKGLCTI